MNGSWVGAPFHDKTSGLMITCAGGDEGTTHLTFADADLPVGACSVMGTTIGHIEVFKRYRGRGYGKRILQACASLGYTEMRPVTSASQRAAEKAGFIPPSDAFEPWTYGGAPAITEEFDSPTP